MSPATDQQQIILNPNHTNSNHVLTLIPNLTLTETVKLLTNIKLLNRYLLVSVQILQRIITDNKLQVKSIVMP